SDVEHYEIQNYVNAAQDTSEDNRNEDRARDTINSSEAVASAETENTSPDTSFAATSDDETENADANTTYAITSDNETVTVYDNDGNSVFETSLDDWETNRDAYYAKYDLGTN